MKKRCTKCEIEKDVSEFYKDRDKEDGLATQCKACKKKWQRSPKGQASAKKQNQRPEQKAAQKKWRESPEGKVKEKAWRDTPEVKAAKKAWAQSPAGKESNRRKSAKRRAKKKNLLCDLAHDQWLEILEEQNYTCNLCDKKFTEELKPQQDHIIPVSKDGPYTKSNIQGLCKSCNCHKGDKDWKEVKEKYNKEN